MRRSLLLSLAAVSLLAAVAAPAATRPAYGGTLRVEVSGSVSSLDPVQGNLFSADAGLRDRIAALLFDGLVRLDDAGKPQPALATSWKHDADLRRWQFVIRSRVKMHDGARLSPRMAVMSLSAANGAWRVHLLGDDVVIESDAPMPELLAELARPRYSLFVRGADGTPVGSGPFRVGEFQPGKRLLLKVNEDYWGGRAYLDGVEITFGRPYRDQAIDLQVDRADVIDVAVDQTRRAAQEGQRVAVSQPVELLAVVFGPKVQDIRVREAISAAIDRASIHSVLLQKQGEPAGSLLPQWVSGYAFLYPTSRSEERVRQLRAGLSPRTLTLAYDWSDPLARAVAERVAVNARDAGITLQAFGENLGAREANADVRLVRSALPSAEPSVALAAITSALGHNDQARQIASATAPDALYLAERSLLQEFVIVPLVYVPEAHALSPRVRNWSVPPLGGWALDDVSLAPEKP